MHIAKAEEENLQLKSEEMGIDEYDEHSIHVEEHTRKLLEGDVNFNIDSKYKKHLAKHLKEHKKFILLKDVENTIKEIESGK